MKKRLVAFLLVLIMVLGMLPTAALATDNGVETQASGQHTVRVRIVPVYEDDSKYLGYDPIYDDGVWLDLTCQNQYCGSGKINHSVKIADFHPDKMQWSIKSGYEWKGWIKYAQNLNLKNVTNPQNKTYYSWSKETTNITVDKSDIYMVYGKKASAQYTYTLNFDGNGEGVSNVPGSLTYTGPETSHSFTIPSTIPTRKGYTFKGWDTDSTATNAVKKGGNEVSVTKESPNATLYAVWEPSSTLIDNLDIVSIVCDDKVHTALNTTLLSGTYEIIEVDQAAGTCVIKITNKDAYVTPYNNRHNAQHTAKTEDVTVKLVFKGQGWWTLKDGDKAVIHTTCGTKDPEGPGDYKPNYEDADGMIRVQCTASPANHEPHSKMYKLMDGAYYENGTTIVDGVYYCSISLNRAAFIKTFDKDTGYTHTDEEPDADTRITWKWDSDKGQWELIQAPDGIIADIKVKCEKEADITVSKRVATVDELSEADQNVFATELAGVVNPVNGKLTVAEGTTSVKLLYAITIKGAAGMTGKLYDDGVQKAGQTSGILVYKDAKTGNMLYAELLGFDGEVTLYVVKTFDVTENTTELSNTARLNSNGKDYTDTCTVELEFEEKPAIPTEKPEVGEYLVRVACEDEGDTGILDSYIASDPGHRPWYTETGIVENNGEYTYSLTLNKEAYIADFASKNGRLSHEEAEGSSESTITWKWENGAWVCQTADIEGAYANTKALIKVRCIPNAPEGAEIGKGNNVTVKCLNPITGKDDCTTAQYGLYSGTLGGFELEKIDSRKYIAKIPVTAFVNAFNGRGDKIPHNLYSADTLNYVVTYANGTWTAAPQEAGVDDVVLLTHAPEKWQEVGKFGPKGVGINATCTTTSFGPISYGLTTAFVYYDTDVVSVTYNETAKTYTAVLKTDKYVESITKGCNDKFHAEDARSHKLTSGNETVTWIFSVNYDTDTNESVWTAAPQTDADAVITVAEELNVTFDLNGGNVNGSTDNVTVKVLYGETVTAPAAVRKTGDKSGYTYDYSLLGWYLADGTEFDFSTPITDNITLKAEWCPPYRLTGIGMIKDGSFVAHCTTDEAHQDFVGGAVHKMEIKPFGAKPELDADGVWTIKASFMPKATVSTSWKKDIAAKWGGITHTYVGEENYIYLKFAWDPVAENWYPTEELTYNRTTDNYDTVKVLEDNIFYVNAKCVTKPDAPKTTTLKLVGIDGTNKDQMVRLKNGSRFASLTLIDGTYTIGEVTGSRAEGFTCEITVTDLQPYVEKLNKNRNETYLLDTTRTANPFVFEMTTARNLKDLSKVTWTWSNAANNTEKNNGKSIYLTKAYTVTFDVDGGTPAPDAQTVRYGEKATKPADPTKDGYNFLGWYLDEAEYDFDTAVTKEITLTAKWELATYTVVAKMELDGEPAYYQNSDYYTFTVSGTKGDAIDFDSIKEQAIAQAKQIRKSAASYTAEIHEDYAPNAVCTTYGEHQPNQTTHYLYVNVKTEMKVRVFASYDGVVDESNLLYDGQAPYGTNLLEFLTANVTNLDKAGYTHAEWYKKDSPKWTFGETDTVRGWTNVLVKYETIPHNIYAFARLNSTYCSLTPVEFGESVQLNAATLKRLGLNAYNANGYISIGTFNFADMPLTEDMYMSYYNENEFNAVVAALKTKLVLEQNIDEKAAEKIAWTVLFKADNDEYMTTAGYPTDDADGYQLSGNLFLASVMFNAGADDVKNMPAANYTYDDIFEINDFYFAGDTITMPEDPTRVGYNFLGWSAKVIPGEEEAELLAAPESETLYKAGDEYVITDGGVLFTAVWEARTDTHYKVKYYIETLDGKWENNDSYEGKGTTGETIDATKVHNKKYEHFTLDLTVDGTVQTGVIAGDGSLVLKLYYTRNTYTYYVHHVKQLPDGSYDTANAEVETLTGKYGAPAVVVAKDYGSHYPTNDAASKQDKTVDVDLVIVVKYDLDNHTLTFNSNGGTPVDAVTVRHGNTVAKPADPTKEGNWRFKDWYTDEACTTLYDFSTPLEEDLTVYAGYDKTSSPLNPVVQMYEIQHIKQLSDGTYDEANAVIERDFAEEGTEINAKAKDYGTHYALNTEKSTMTGKVVKVTTGEDGKPVYTVLKVYYDLDNHTLTFDPNGGSAVNPDKVTVRHGAPVTDGPLLPPTKTGYNFTGWYLDKDGKTAFDASAGIIEDTTVYAGWTPAKPVVVVYKLTVNYVFQNGKTAAPSAVLELVPGASYNVESPKLASYNADRLAVKGTMPEHDVTETVTYYPQGAILPVAKKAPKLNTTEHFAYVQGYPNGTVKPAGNITRAETAAILFRLMTADSRSTYYSTKSGFRDVSTSAWYNTYVATLNAAGVITDSANGYFRPNDAITRAELAAMLAQFADATKAANYFTDVSASYWASNAIAVCSKLGWINGYPDGTFRPDKNVTRAEMMAMINRATGRTPQSADAFLPGMKTWTDNAATAWYYLDVQEATNSHSYTKKGNAELWSGLTSDPNWSLYE